MRHARAAPPLPCHWPGRVSAAPRDGVLPDYPFFGAGRGVGEFSGSPGRQPQKPHGSPMVPESATLPRRAKPAGALRCRFVPRSARLVAGKPPFDAASHSHTHPYTILCPLTIETRHARRVRTSMRTVISRSWPGMSCTIPPGSRFATAFVLSPCGRQQLLRARDPRKPPLEYMMD